MSRTFIQIMLVLSFLSGSGELIAQSFGIKGGLNLSTQRYRIEGQQIEDDSRARWAYHLGFEYEQQVNERSGFMLELLYSAEGAGGSDGQGVMKLNYLNLPALYYYQWPSGFRLYGGAVIGYLLNVRTNSHGFGTDRRDAYENFVLSAAVGSEYVLNEGWRIGARYNRGISDFLNRDFYSFDLRSHTDTFQVYLIFNFRIL